MKTKLFATGGNGPRRDSAQDDDDGGVDPEVPVFDPKKSPDKPAPAPAAPN